MLSDLVSKPISRTLSREWLQLPPSCDNRQSKPESYSSALLTGRRITIKAVQLQTNVPLPFGSPWDVVRWPLWVVRSRQSGSRGVKSAGTDALDNGS